MALQLPPELEQRVTQIARESARTPADVLADLVSAALELGSDQELWAAGESGTELERANGIPHERVVQEMRAIIDRARAVAAGQGASFADVLRAGVDALEREAAEDAASSDADAAVWQAYKARRSTDPRDMTASEVLACLDNEDPEKQHALGAHLDVLVDDLRAGRGVTGTTADMMADIRASLGLRLRS